MKIRKFSWVWICLLIAACADDDSSVDMGDVTTMVGGDSTESGTGRPAASISIDSDSLEVMFDVGADELVLLRDEIELLRFDLQSFPIGTVPRVSANTNYDPYYFFSGITGGIPSGLDWVNPVGWTGTVLDNVLRLTLDYGALGEGTVQFEVNGERRISAQYTPPTMTPIAFLRMRPKANADEGFYGVGNTLDSVNHRGKVRPLQIVVDPTLETGFAHAFVTVPLTIGSTGWGLLVENHYPGAIAFAIDDEHRIDYAFGTANASDEGLRFYLFVEDHPLDLTAHYYAVSGQPRLPARWALGPIIWRNENRDQEQVISDVETMRDLDLPASAYWIDRPYARAVNSFDFTPEKFDDPQGMIDRIQDLGYRFALWHTPYVGEETEATAELHQFALDNGYYPPSTGLGLYLNDWGRLVDLTNPDAYAWWQSLISKYTDMGVEGFKLDFAQDIQTGLNLLRNPWRFHDGSDERTMHSRYQNLYHQVYAELLPEEGGFLLCRSGKFGDQVNGPIIWPGDIDANFAYHREEMVDGDETYVAIGGLPGAQIESVGLGMAGFPFYGSDTGGYLHSPPNKEVFTRWFQQTALSSVMQIGTATNNVAWEFSDETGFDQEMLDWYRKYTRLHLRLFPYEWTYAHRLLIDGRPIQRPMGLQKPALGNHGWETYFFGDDLLVAPVVRADQREQTVTFPEGIWFDWWTGIGLEGGMDRVVDAPLDTLPLYLRAGGIVPMLRPTIDTIAPTKTPELVDSLDTAPGRLHVRMGLGPSSEFQLYDGSVISHSQNEDNTLMVSVTEGDEYKDGWQLEVVGVTAEPVAVTSGDEIENVQNLDGDEETTRGWQFISSLRRLLVRLPSGDHAVEVVLAAP